MAFILNPYNANLDLTNRDNRKLFEVGYKGLETKDTEFVKLTEKEFKDIRVMSALNIATEWEAAGKRPDQDKMVDIFHSNHKVL